MNTQVTLTDMKSAGERFEQIQASLCDLAGAKLIAVSRTTGPGQLVPSWRLCFEHGRTIIAEGDLDLSSLDGPCHAAPTADQIQTALQRQSVTHAWIGDDASLSIMFDQHWALTAPTSNDVRRSRQWTFSVLGENRWRLTHTSHKDTAAPAPPGSDASNGRARADAGPLPSLRGGQVAEPVGTVAVVRATDIAALLERYLAREVTADQLRAWAADVDARLGTMLTIAADEARVARVLKRLNAAEPIDECDAVALIAALTGPSLRRSTWFVAAAVALAGTLIPVWELVAR